jgi:hypothetical protein
MLCRQLFTTHPICRAGSQNPDSGRVQSFSLNPTLGWVHTVSLSPGLGQVRIHPFSGTRGRYTQRPSGASQRGQSPLVIPCTISIPYRLIQTPDVQRRVQYFADS